MQSSCGWHDQDLSLGITPTPSKEEVEVEVEVRLCLVLLNLFIENRRFLDRGSQKNLDDFFV